MRIALTLLLTLALPVSAAELSVTTAADVVDAGDGLLSLREAITAAASGDTVVFAFPLDGATITTTGGTFDINQDLTIDAGPLPAGIRLDAQLDHRLFDISAGNALTLTGLSLLNGRTTTGNGGGAQVFGNLTMRHCLVSGCIGGFGGGIAADGEVVVDLENCTFSGNRCRNGGSAIAGTNGTDFILRHCTVYNNTGFSSGPAIGAGSGGFFLGAGTSTTLSHTAFGENRDGNGNLFSGFYAGGATSTSEGHNSIDQAAGPGAQPTDLIDTDPMLGPLEYWGGKTACHRPLPGSPLIDAGDPAIATAPLRDQIFAPRQAGTIDIGAVERGTGTFEQWCEFYAVTADPVADDDGDGSSQLFEYVYGTNPDDRGEAFEPIIGFDSGGIFSTTTQIDLAHGDTAHFLERSDNLGAWAPASITIPANAASLVLLITTYPDAAAVGRGFHRSRVYLGRPQ